MDVMRVDCKLSKHGKFNTYNIHCLQRWQNKRKWYYRFFPMHQEINSGGIYNERGDEKFTSESLVLQVCILH